MKLTNRDCNGCL